MTNGKGAAAQTAPRHRNTNNDKDADKHHFTSDDGAGEDIQTGLAFIGHLDELGIPLWVAQRNPRWPDHGDEFFRPKGWQKLTADGNVERLETFSPGDAVCVNTGGTVVVVDVDPRNGGDIEKVRALLGELGARIYAELATPGDGRHFYIAGHPELPNVHSTADNNRLPGFPGVDIQSFGCNVFLPLTERPKYQGKGYTVVSDDLEALASAPADAGEPLARWVGEQRAGRARRVASATDKKDYFALPIAPPGSGAKPDARQQAYLSAVLANAASDVAKAEPGGRNDTLFTQAMKCGSFVAGTSLDQDAVVDALMKAAEECGLFDDDGAQSVYATMVSAFRIAANHPRAVPPEADREFESAVAEELHKLRVREEARRRLAIEKAAEAPTFEAVLLADVPLYCPEDDFRITGLMPSNASTVLNAQHKAGKTTLALNLAHSLLLGEKFLDEFRVNPISGRVAHLNYEVAGEQLGYWARQAGLPEDRFLQINLRGKRNPFAHPEDLERLAEKLRAYEVESLIVDPFGQAYPRTNQDSSGEVGAWLAQLNMFSREQAGVCDLILVVHAGWNQERARGSSALGDWPDSIIYLTRKEDTDKRYFRAIGRDVWVDEDALNYDPDTRRLSLSKTGGRKHNKSQEKEEAKIEALVDPVCAQVQHNPGLSQNEILKHLRKLHQEGALTTSFQDHHALKAITKAVERGFITYEDDGPGKPHRHFWRG